MPTLFERIVQFGGSTWRRNEGCRRAVCRRYRYCVPPRDEKHRCLFRCPFDTDDAWLSRAAMVEKIVQRLMKVADTSRAARGQPSPFAPKSVPDHLDLTKPLDLPTLFALPPEAES